MWPKQWPTGLVQDPVSENTIENIEDDTEHKLLSSTHAHSGKQHSAHITNIHITQVYIPMQNQLESNVCKNRYLVFF